MTLVKATCCGAEECNYTGDGKPCWGQLEVEDEETCGDDWWWLHSCEGHRGASFSGFQYKPEPA